jgi:ATP-dependent Clp protease ATP-binding subunit ClpA
MTANTLETTMYNAFVLAEKNHHKYVTTAHLLLSLLDNTEVADFFVHCSADIEKIKTELFIHIEEDSPLNSATPQAEIVVSPEFNQLIYRCVCDAGLLKLNKIHGINLVLTLLNNQIDLVARILMQEGVTKEKVTKFFLRNAVMDAFPAHETIELTAQIEGQAAVADPFAGLELNKYAQNINQLVLAGQVKPVIGRDSEIAQCVQTLSRCGKSNPLFVGEAGVGKTTIVWGLAQAIVDKTVPEKLQDSVIFSLDLASLVAGSKFRGDFEERMQLILQEIKAHPQIILFIDEIHNMTSLGGNGSGTLDLGEYLKPALSSGDIRCMGATTYAEFREYFAKDAALARRFQKIDVKEPTVKESMTILKGLKNKLEAHHGISISDAALERAIELSDKYMLDRHLPDKAIDVVDETAAHVSINASKLGVKGVCKTQVEQTFATMTRLPFAELSAAAAQSILTLDSRLNDKIFGQEEAISKITQVIKVSHAGLKREDKPMGSFLLTGSTGTGKTELCKQLANELGVKLIRFDMSEYMEKHAVAKLIGTPPGYVGFEQGGLLVEQIIKNPHCVLLLDEIEKAHPDIFNVLLQALDYGRLTDNTGRVADLRHLIIVMSSNVGGQSMQSNGIGFLGANKEENVLADCAEVFSPEFRNRLDAIVPFNPLSKDIMVSIVEKYLAEINEQLSVRNLDLTVTASAKAWLAESGFDNKMGARYMERLIQEEIKMPLANKLLAAGHNDATARVKVRTAKGQLVIDYVN